MNHSTVHRPAFLLIMAMIATMNIASISAAEHSSAIPYAPVQAGFVREAHSVLPYAPGRILVKFHADALEVSMIDREIPRAQRFEPRTGLSSFDALCRAVNATAMSKLFNECRYVDQGARIGIDRWFVIEYTGTEDPVSVAREFRNNRSVEAASPDWRAFPAAVPNDPMHYLHWGHDNTAQMLSYDWSTNSHENGSPVGTVGFDANAEAAWNGSQGYGSSGITIAILDSGVDIDHPDLRLVTGYDFGDDDSNPDDNSSQPGHGTACAGVAAAMANNGLGTAGIAGGCSIMPLKVADSGGSMYFSSIVLALEYAADNGADVASMSLGASGMSSDPSTDDALLYAYNAGVTLLAATGNENASAVSYPAINTHVIAIGAASPCGERKRSSSSSSEVNPGVNTDPNGYTCDGERWWGSNYGVNYVTDGGAVDVIAPTILPTTDIGSSGGYDSGDYFKWFNGTSCATPYAAGVCALIKAANPSYTPSQIRTQLRNTAQDVTSVESGAGWDRYTGYGMVDAEAAVGGTPSNSVTVTDPNGGETWTAGDVEYITWTSTGSISTVAIDYSTNGGSSWTSITGSTSNDGSYGWTVPSAATTQARVRVSDASDPATNDISNANFEIYVPSTGDYATVPYSTGFESGGFDQYWTGTSTVDGRIRFLTTNTPHTGSYHMTMDDAVSGGFSQNEAWLYLNLAGESQVDLTFWWKDFGDETHTQDGIYFSDNGGTSFTKVYDLNGASYTNNTWREFTLDIDDLASSNGLSLSSTFVVKFQQYDNYPMTSDGFAFDDISVSGGGGSSYITAETEPNDDYSSSNGPVGSGVPVTGSISTSSEVDWFYMDVTTAGNLNISLSIGSSADLDWFLYDDGLTEVARGYTTSNPEAGSYYASPGRYYLMVDGYLSATSSYTLNVTGGIVTMTSGSEKPLPLEFGLHANWPNPFESKTAIRFDLPTQEEVDLAVYDQSGRKVTSLCRKTYAPGSHLIVWDGRDEQGRTIPSGIYFYRIKAGNHVDTRRMVRLK